MTENDPLANESAEYRAWVEAGAPEPTAAERTDEGKCYRDDCDNDADYIVEWERQKLVRMCQSCSVSDRVYAKENDLLSIDITADRDAFYPLEDSDL